MGPELQSQLDAFLAPKSDDGVDKDEEAPEVRKENRIDNLSRISPGKILKAGYLHKLGGNKSGSAGNWKKRYFVLQDDMKYYEDEATFKNGGTGKGLVKLNVFFVSVSDDAETSDKDDKSAPVHQFTVHAMPHPLVCRADTKEEMDSWVSTLNSLADLGR